MRLSASYTQTVDENWKTKFPTTKFNSDKYTFLFRGENLETKLSLLEANYETLKLKARLILF